MDVYRDREKIRTEQIAGPMPGGEALEELCEHDQEYLAEELDGKPDDYRHDAD